MSRLLIFVIFILLVIACAKAGDDKLSYFDKHFIGFWADTEWNYRFYRDGRFEMECKGHYTFNTFPGVYFIVDSIVYLTPHSDWQVLDGVIPTKLKIAGQDCLRDNFNRFYCTSIDDLIAKTEVEYQWQEKVISVLDSLPAVIAKKRLIPTKERYDNVEIRYNRIIVVDQNELHQFSLENYSMDDPMKYMDFLVQRNPINIYLHHSVRDSLSLVYSERRN